MGQIEQTQSTLRFGLNAKMIQNKVVANVMKRNLSLEDENELRGLLNEYQRRLHDIEKDNESKSLQLKLAIETLMKEKNELS